MKYLIETYGCQLNVAESNSLELQLIGMGLSETSIAEEADYVILNTCSVRKSAESRVWGRLSYFGHVKKTKKNKIIVTGCMAERLKEDLKNDAPFVDVVVGTNEKQKIVDYISGSVIEKKDNYQFTTSYYKPGDFSSYVPIMNGCNNFCTYCIVPYVRGREISRNIDDILAEIKDLDSKGVKEITLLGQNVNSYNFEKDGVVYNFPKLLTEVCKHLDSIIYVRFDSSHPKDFSDELIEVIKNEERVAKHIHLPLQSGSSRILGLMNRKTDREKILALVDKIAKIDNVTFATDVMVGFPGETEEEYEETLSLMEYMQNIEAFMYYFNVREGTPAEKMDNQISLEDKTRRLERLINEQLERVKVIKQKRLPLSTNAIITGVTRDDKEKFLARNEHNEMFSFSPIKDHKVGDVVYLEADGIKGNTYLAKEI